MPLLFNAGLMHGSSLIIVCHATDTTHCSRFKCVFVPNVGIYPTPLFQISNRLLDMTPCRQHVFLTGPPGVGKTTIIQKVCKELQLKRTAIKGFFTSELRENGRRVGFDIISLDGTRSPLARVGEGVGPKVGQYLVDVKSFESIALPLLQPGEGKHVTVLDEVGKMELFSQRFQLDVQKLFETNTIILGTIPIQKGRHIPLVEFIRTHPTVKLITVDYKNRDSVPYEIVNHLTDTSHEGS